MRPNRGEGDAELLALAEATDRVANSVDDQVIAARLRLIAGEVRSMARWAPASADGRDAPGASFVPA